MKNFSFFKTLCLSLSVAVGAQAQTPAPAADTQAPRMSRYERTHGGTPGVFRRDPNVWVMTPEVAERSGMPKAWASSELKGVAAAAFRREPEGAEADCGFGGNKNACQPVINCVLELYFDRNTHLLPWREGSSVAAFDTRYVTSSSHFLSNIGWEPDRVTGAVGKRSLREPFTDPVSGQGLFWRTAGSKNGFGYFGIVAYDREIHGSFSYLKLTQGCSRGKPGGKGEPLQLISQNANGVPIKTYYEIFLPAEWEARTYEEAMKDRQQDENFYKGVFQGMQSGGANK